jgi:hypothetical protein
MGAQRYEIYLRVFKLDISQVRAGNKHFAQIQKKNRGNR